MANIISKNPISIIIDYFKKPDNHLAEEKGNLDTKHVSGGEKGELAAANAIAAAGKLDENNPGNNKGAEAFLKKMLDNNNYKIVKNFYKESLFLQDDQVSMKDLDSFSQVKEALPSKAALEIIIEYFKNKENHKKGMIFSGYDEISKEELRSAKGKLGEDADKFIDSLVEGDNYEYLKNLRRGDGWLIFNNSQITLGDLYDLSAILPDDPEPVKNNSDSRFFADRYDQLIDKNQYLIIVDGKGFIQDPSQSGKIVSEGQSYWQLINAKMAEVDPNQARKYQENFDKLLEGTKYMAVLAVESGNTGVFPAWKVKLESGKIVLDTDEYGKTANSASDADMDLIRSLINAQKLVDANVWVDKGYGAYAKELIDSATFGNAALFRDEQGVRVQRPSEDWDAFHFTDYLSPATCLDIAGFAKKSKMGEDYANYWTKAANDSLKLYQEAFADTGEFPANIEFNVTNESTVEAKPINNSKQEYDGIRSPWRIADYIMSNKIDNTDVINFAKKVLAKGANVRYTKVGLDAAMYLPLAAAVDNKGEIQRLFAALKNNAIGFSNYYEQTLILLSLLTTSSHSELDLSQAVFATTDNSPIAKPKSITESKKKDTPSTSAVTNNSTGSANLDSRTVKWIDRGWKGNPKNEFSFTVNDSFIKMEGRVVSGYYLGGNGFDLKLPSINNKIYFDAITNNKDACRLQLRIKINEIEYGYDINLAKGVNPKAVVPISDFKKVKNGWDMNGQPKITYEDIGKVNKLQFEIGITSVAETGEYQVDIPHFKII
ncbi:MAG TPA: hypothetical protein DCS13_12940 [Candidatus Margulisbacteria bacterium]|nr:MAG: hypothetical protein A2X43_04885 [Candidatus Margulisbacteria bacterium GWD2_39_127]HAR64364.1 hypothetical protein [Candidatus Margulisiibacteriota bacterium]